MGFELPFIGLLISLIFTGITGLFPGGIIVPSYLVLFYNQPARIAGTLIAALLKAPSRYSPLVDSDLAIKRRNVVLKQMKDTSIISETTYKKAKKTGIKLIRLGDTSNEAR